MPEGTLPGGRSIQLQVYLTAVLVGVGSGVLIVAFAVPVLRLPASQLPFALRLAVIAGVLFAALSQRIQKLRVGRIANYLDRRAAGTASDEERRLAFAETTSLPLFLVTLAFSQFALVGLAVALALFWRYETFTLQSLTLTMAACMTAGFLSQLFVYLRLRRVFQPIRNTLAMEIDDPEVRGRLVKSFPLASQMFTAIVGLVISSTLLSATLTQGRAAGTIEAHTTRLLDGVLDEVLAEAGPDPDPLALVEHPPRETQLVLLDRDASHVVAGSADALLGEELDAMRSLETRTGESSGFESRNAFAWRAVPGDDRILVAVRSLDTVHEAIGGTTGFMVAVIGAYIAVATLLALALSRDLREATGQLQRMLRRVAAGDLSRREVLETEDEFGALARSVDAMTAALRGTIRSVVHAADRVEGAAGEISGASESVISGSTGQLEGVQKSNRAMQRMAGQVEGIAEATGVLGSAVEESANSIHELATMGESLSDSGSVLHAKVDEVSSSIEELSRSIQEVATNADGLATAADETTAGIEEVAAALREVDVNASDASDLSARMVGSAERGRERVKEMIDGMERIQEATEAAEGVVQSLGARAQQIGQILSVIDDVADETNLLALNAAIISAQAGEHGRSFAVVADEIKELADRVMGHTREIGEVVGSLQSEAANAVGAIERGSRSVQAGVDLSGDAGMMLEEITEAAHASGTRTEQIVLAVREQSQASNHMVNLMERVASGVAEIRTAVEEQNRSTQHVLHSAVDMGVVAKQLEGATGELSSSGSRIRSTVARVESASEEIARAHQEQAGACQETRDVLVGVEERARANEASARVMEEAMDGLRREADSLREAVKNFVIDEEGVQGRTS